jgi:hypothetical protein
LGYQLLGEIERVEELAMMNGYIPGKKKDMLFPKWKDSSLFMWRKSLILAMDRTATGRSRKKGEGILEITPQNPIGRGANR